MAEVFSPVVLYVTTNAPDGTSTFYPFPNPPSSQATGPASRISYLYSSPSSNSGPSLADNVDLEHHLIACTEKPLTAFPAEGGTVGAIVDIGPNPTGAEGFMHKTNTLDYCFIMDGELELTLNSGEKRIVKKGEIVIQRACMHKWRNMSKTEPARMAAIAIGAVGAVEGGMEFPKPRE